MHSIWTDYLNIYVMGIIPIAFPWFITYIPARASLKTNRRPMKHTVITVVLLGALLWLAMSLGVTSGEKAADSLATPSYGKPHP